MSNVEPIPGPLGGGTQAAAFGLYPAGVNLAGVAKAIETGGLLSENVCILLPENHPTSEAVRRLSSGAETSAHLQAVLAWLGKFGAVVIRGLGSFVSTRRFAAALVSGKGGSGDAVLRGLGMAAPDSDRYASSIGTGGVFLFLYCESEREAKYASELLATTGAEEAGYKSIEKVVEMPSALRRAV
jgi:hypothetical protein